MDLKHDVNVVRAQTPFIALVFAVFACASRVVDDPRLNDEDDGGLGMVYYERYAILSMVTLQKRLMPCSQKVADSPLYQPSSYPDGSRTMHCPPFLVPLFGKLLTASLVACRASRPYVSRLGLACTSHGNFLDCVTYGLVTEIYSARSKYDCARKTRTAQSLLERLLLGSHAGHGAWATTRHRGYGLRRRVSLRV